MPLQETGEKNTGVARTKSMVGDSEAVAKTRKDNECRRVALYLKKTRFIMLLRTSKSNTVKTSGTEIPYPDLLQNSIVMPTCTIDETEEAKHDSVWMWQPCHHQAYL
ncbi:MAG: hypothetical protein PWR16_1287 [Methanoculleus sp.]|nr:hypothetical protein [Methanoculleus sp.]